MNLLCNFAVPFFQGMKWDDFTAHNQVFQNCQSTVNLTRETTCWIFRIHPSKTMKWSQFYFWHTGESSQKGCTFFFFLISSLFSKNWTLLSCGSRAFQNNLEEAKSEKRSQTKQCRRSLFSYFCFIGWLFFSVVDLALLLPHVHRKNSCTKPHSLWK